MIVAKSSSGIEMVASSPAISSCPFFIWISDGQLISSVLNAIETLPPIMSKNRNLLANVLAKTILHCLFFKKKASNDPPA